MWDCCGFLIVEDALSPAEIAACLDASRRVHSDPAMLQRLSLEQFGEEQAATVPATAEELAQEWRQIGNAYEHERAFECLIDHPSVFPKARALFGGHLILQGSWLTQVPPGYAKATGAGMHQVFGREN